MNHLRKICLLLSVIVLTVGFLPLTSVAAKSAKINKSNITLVVGKSYTLKISNNSKKVKWSSSAKSIATVNNKGKVTAKKAGKATITGKVGKKKFTCKVVVKNKTLTKKQKYEMLKNYLINTGTYASGIYGYSMTKESDECVYDYYIYYSEEGKDIVFSVTCESKDGDYIFEDLVVRVDVNNVDEAYVLYYEEDEDEEEIASLEGYIYPASMTTPYYMEYEGESYLQSVREDIADILYKLGILMWDEMLYDMDFKYSLEDLGFKS